MMLASATVRRCGALLLALVLVPGAGYAAEPDSLGVGLVGYLACDGDLSSVTPAGEGAEAGFARHSQAFNDDLQPVAVNEPRFAEGRFGLGVLVEPGSAADDARRECRNWLPPEIAQVTARGGAALPFVGFEGAAVGLIQATEEEARGRREPILEGRTALHVTCPTAGSGVETRSPVGVPNGSYTASAYVRGNPGSPADDRVELLLLDGVSGAVLGRAALTVAEEWRRVQLNAEVEGSSAEGAAQATATVTLRVTAQRAGQVVVLDAFMLERRAAGAGSASSWVPGQAWRASEVLDLDDLRPCLAAQTGSVAFWLRCRGIPQARRVLFELAGPTPGEPYLQVTLLDEARLRLGQGRQAVADAAVEADLAAWHHLALTWTSTHAVLYLDGARVSECSGLSIPAHLSALHLACSGPQAAANAVLDDVLLYHRVLADEDVQRLARLDQPCAGLPLPAVTLRPERFIETIAQGLTPQVWRCDVRNRGPAALREVDVTFRLGGSLTLTRRLEGVAAGGVGLVEFSFLADLAVGTYPFTVTACSGDREWARFSRRVDITPAPEPAGNLQVLPWQRTFDPSYGFTCGGGDLAETMRQGLGWAPHHRYLGYPRAIDGDDLEHDMNDRPGRVRLSSPYIAEQVRREAARFAERLAAVPAARAVTLNSGAQWTWSHDYTPESVLWVRRTFQIDLDAWRQPPRGDPDAHQLPFGRLRPGPAGLAPPADRSVDAADPLYAYHRWFHGPRAPTESFLNQTLSEEILARRADILTIQEPILRRPAVRAFDRVSIAQEEFSCADPMRAVMVQEALNAAVRGTDLRPAGMPQLRLPAGSAAPYHALPSADLFTEAAWLCALQPIRLFTYRGFEVLPKGDVDGAPYRLQTQAQIEALFAAAEPSWAAARKVLDADPELARTLLAWTPELLAAFTRFHRDEAGPLGALIPAWHNRPRRVAVVRSFASQLYGEVRWPATTWLETCVVSSGVPFDVLLDEDFETSADPLAPYSLVVVSAAACLPRPALAALRRCLERGGVVLSDPETRVALPGARILRPADAAGAAGGIVGPAPAPGPMGNEPDPEALEAVLNPLPASGPQGLAEPAFLEIFERAVDPEARTLSPFTWLNLLEAEGACYLGVVNDLRVHGPLYGHFGTVRETGVPHHALVRFRSALGSVAYDLLAHAPAPLSVADDGSTLDLDLPPGGARVLVLLPETIGSLELQAQVEPATWGDHHGRQVTVHAVLLDVQGRIVPGLIPATLTWRHPDGSRSDFSHHTVFRRGVLDAALPVLANGPPGTWHVQLLERASGRTAEVAVPVH